MPQKIPIALSWEFFVVIRGNYEENPKIYGAPCP